MGCATSRLAAAPGRETEEDVVAPAAAPGSKAETTRSRRLSYSVEAKAGLAHAEAIVTRASSGSSSTNKHPGGGGGGSGSPRATNLNARSRRLSHVYSEEEAGGQRGSGNSEGGRSAQQHQQHQQHQQQRSPSSNLAGDGSGTKPSGGGVRVSIACVSRTGREPGCKKTNQDACLAFEQLCAGTACFAVCDGHGPNGHHVAQHVRRFLPPTIAACLAAQTGHGSVADALTAAFLAVDASLAEQSGIDCQFSGCTCAVALLQGRTLTTAWVGDSRMVLGREHGEAAGRGKAGGAGGSGWGFRGGRGALPLRAVDVSVDHKPAQREELARILGANGRVERLVDEEGAPLGPHRVWLRDAWLPGLAMSRALGDQLAHTVGVSSEPQCMTVQLTDADKLLVLASDGVWEFISSQEALDIVAGAGSPEEGARTLVDAAHRCWQEEEQGVCDDITVVYVALSPESSAR